MAELEVIDSSGNKELIKIKDIKNPDKDIYEYCLFKKFDYKKLKDLKNQFNKKYNSIKEKNKNNNKSNNSFRSFSKRSLSVNNRRNRNYLFPFQIIVSKTPRNLSNINFNLSNRKNNNKMNKSFNKKYNSKLLNLSSFEKSEDKIFSKRNKFNKEEYDKRFEKIFLNIKNNNFEENKKIKEDKNSKNKKKINYGDILYDKGKKFKKEKEEKIQFLQNKLLEEEKIKGFNYFPKTNLISDRALKKRKQKNLEFNNPETINNYSDYKENIIKKVKKKNVKDFNEKNKNETFHPLINKKSKDIKNDFQNIYEKLYFDRQIKEEHLKQLEEKEKKLYSFHPELNPEYKLDNPNNSIFQKYPNIILQEEEKSENVTQQQ